MTSSIRNAFPAEFRARYFDLVEVFEDAEQLHELSEEE